MGSWERWRRRLSRRVLNARAASLAVPGWRAPSRNRSTKTAHGSSHTHARTALRCAARTSSSDQDARQTNRQCVIRSGRLSVCLQRETSWWICREDAQGFSCLALLSFPSPIPWERGGRQTDRALTDPGQFDEFVTDIRVRNQLVTSRSQFHKQMLHEVVLHVVTLCTVSIFVYFKSGLWKRHGHLRYILPIMTYSSPSFFHIEQPA